MLSVSRLHMIAQLINVEQLVILELVRDTEVRGQDPPQCHFWHQMTHMTGIGKNLSRCWNLATNRMDSNTTHVSCYVQFCLLKFLIVAIYASKNYSSILGSDKTEWIYIAVMLRTLNREVLGSNIVRDTWFYLLLYSPDGNIARKRQCLHCPSRHSQHFMETEVLLPCA
jgi:hypothetical protein